LGLGPAQSTWAGLDPASPARSLAQASDSAGHMRHVCRAFSFKIKTGGEDELMKRGEYKNRAEDLPGSFAESLREMAKGDISASSFLLLPSVCVPCCIPFLCLYFGLFFFVFMLCFQNTVSLSFGRFSLSFFLSQNWWGKPISSMGVLEMNQKIVCFACVSLLFGFFRLSLFL